MSDEKHLQNVSLTSEGGGLTNLTHSPEDSVVLPEQRTQLSIGSGTTTNPTDPDQEHIEVTSGQGDGDLNDQSVAMQPSSNTKTTINGVPTGMYN